MLANLTLQDRILAKTQASSFMLDMNELVRALRHRALAAGTCKGRLDVKGQHQDRLDEGTLRWTIKPDLLFSAERHRPRCVADVKYKLTDDTAAGRNADYYQLLAYTTARSTCLRASSSTASTPTVPTTPIAT